jgi:hypothetical protein
MESSNSYIELAALSRPVETPRWRAISEGSFLLHKSNSLQTVGTIITTDAAIQTDFEEEIDIKALVKEKALSIGLHVALIATFETLFFFQFVSGLADKGITNVVDRFSGQLFGGCQNLTFPVRLELLEILDTLGNYSGLALENEKAQLGRAATNSHLLISSWLFTGGLYIAWALAAFILRRDQPWKIILLENAVMISVLAAYEAVFVNVIVLKYDSITLPEIEDRMFNNAYNACI